jgi:hypothetical protein
MKYTEKFLIKQIPYLDKYVHFAMFSFVNMFVFCLIMTTLKEKYVAYLICLGFAIGWEVLQKVKGGQNTFSEAFADAFASQFTALMFLGLTSLIQ